MHNKENLRLIQTHAAAVRVEHPALSPSLHFVNLSCLCWAVSAPHRARSLRHCSLSSSVPCHCFGALLEVFRISMFTTTTLTQEILNNWIIKVSRSAHVFTSCVYCSYAVRVCAQWTYVRYIYIYTHIYIRKIPPFNSLVWGSHSPQIFHSTCWLSIDQCPLLLHFWDYV